MAAVVVLVVRLVEDWLVGSAGRWVVVSLGVDFADRL